MKRKGISTTENSARTEVDAAAPVRSVVSTEDLPDGFQMTELGPLPKEWRVVRLGEVLQLMRNGLTYRQEGNHKGVPVTRIETISDGNINPNKVGYISSIDRGQIEKYRLLPGDILFSHINSEPHLGKTAIYQENPPLILHGMNLLLLRAHPSVSDPYFLFYLLNHERAKGTFIGLAARAVGQSSINMGKLRNLSVPLPPLPEQRAIAHVLRTVQRAKEATEGVIAALKELKKSLMQHLFTYGPVPVTERERVPLQETEIGPIPAHWRVVRLGEVGKVITGRTPSTARPEYWNGHIPFITPADLNGMPIQVAQRFITEEGLKEAKALPKGAVLVSCIGYIGKVGVVDSEIAATNQQINAVIVDSSKISNWFLAYAVMRESNLLESRARKTTVPILHKTNFERIPIPLPPLPEQREIARILQAVDAKIAAEERRRAALEDLFKTLLHELMSGRRRVSLATQSLGE
jgi:type I restriction enzyme S subunit